jgi:predicted nucleic acid-binding Zn finger protein
MFHGLGMKYVLLETAAICGIIAGIVVVAGYSMCKIFIVLLWKYAKAAPRRAQIDHVGDFILSLDR